MKRFINLFKLIIELIETKVDPIRYAKRKGVKLGSNVKFYGCKPGMFSTEPWLITIGNNVYITSNCRFITHDGGTLILRKEVPDLELTAPIRIGNDVYIGIGTTILPGTSIGNRCIVGACSCVKGTFPDNSVIAGVPARVIKTVDEYLEGAKEKSLHLGHLKGKEKEKELKKFFNITHI
ncbi:MAG: acyltransferase [Tissierellaceae bacterium]|nr:acyltransferase [Tissierellaceae bacterium]